MNNKELGASWVQVGALGLVMNLITETRNGQLSI